MAAVEYVSHRILGPVQRGEGRYVVVGPIGQRGLLGVQAEVDLGLAVRLALVAHIGLVGLGAR
eukprot:13918260-Alexandrium_andersonii.AAC.1